MSLPNIDPALFREAARRLDHAQLGALTCVALRLARGPAHRRELGRQSNVPPDHLDRIDGWLRMHPETAMVDGLVVPGIVARRPRGQKQGQLFDDAMVTPVSPKSSNLRAATIAAGVRVLGRAGIGAETARLFLGQMLKNAGFGVLAEAIDAVEPKLDGIAEPRAWIAAYVRNHTAPAANAAANSDPGSRVRGSHPAAANVPPTERIRPLATPDYLGISPGKQRQIREQNRRIEEASKEIFRRCSGEK